MEQDRKIIETIAELSHNTENAPHKCNNRKPQTLKRYHSHRVNTCHIFRFFNSKHKFASHKDYLEFKKIEKPSLRKILIDQK